MAKVNAIGGLKTGKLGGTVYSVVNGQQVEREYRKNIANPNTPAQVENRAKLKLMSQLAAIAAPVIAIKREGTKSGRNIFIAENYGLATFVGDAAQINLNRVQLTKGVLSIGEFAINRESGTALVCNLKENMAAEISRVVYVAMVKEADGSMHLHDTKSISIAGADGKFEGSLRYTDKAVVVYSYGVRDNTDNARAKFLNLNAPNAEQVAKLLTSRALSTSDVTLTDTKGCTLLQGEDNGASDDVAQISVNVSASGNGSVSGGGRFAVGQIVTLHATPDEEAEFEGWYENSVEGTLLSSNPTYQFEANTSIVIVGRFVGGPTPKYQISASFDPAAAGSIAGAGLIEEGNTCTLTATLEEDYEFLGWYENDVLVSENLSISFIVSAARTLVAKAQLNLWKNVKVNNESIDSDKTISYGDIQFTGDTVEKNGDYKVIGTTHKPLGADDYAATNSGQQTGMATGMFNNTWSTTSWSTYASYEIYLVIVDTANERVITTYPYKITISA